MALWLHDDAHDAKYGMEGTIERTSDYSGDGGVIPALARSQNVGVGGVEAEASAAVL